MELQPVKCVAVTEKLVRGEDGRPETHTAGWNIKSVPVPMCGDKLRRNSSPKRIVARDWIKRDLKKTHFGLTGLHSCSQSESHELGAQAQAEGRFSNPCGVADECAFA